MVTPKIITAMVVASYDIEMSVDSLISKLQKDRDLFTKEGWTNLKIEIDMESQWGDRDRDRVNLYGSRVETPEEAKIREDYARARTEAQEARDRADFERLSQKFK